MSDSPTVTIPAAQHPATAETRPARLLRALAQNPEPLSTPALASLLAEPGKRQRLLASYDRGRRRRSTPQNRTGAAHGHRTGPGTGRSPRHLHPPDSAHQPQTRRSPAQGSRLHPQPDRRGLPCQQRGSARTSSGTRRSGRPPAHPPRMPKPRKPLPAEGHAIASELGKHALATPGRPPMLTHSSRQPSCEATEAREAGRHADSAAAHPATPTVLRWRTSIHGATPLPSGV
jgi:hypothetical protein